MKSIKIFVSHRIDIDSELINNPLYIPVRCGAVYDKRENISILGDDTGINISEKRMSFCEFTVQYWAWKNQEADYYGLCHYRRYLSFESKKFKTDTYNMVQGLSITPKNKLKYNLLDFENMRNIICKYDIIVSEYANVNEISTNKGKQETVYDLWKAHVGLFFEMSSIELMFKLIDEMAPQYSSSAREYFSGNLHRGFNCYILRKELFSRLCEFQFPIMFKLEELLNTEGYSQTMNRTVAFIGEMLYGIFIYHISNYEEWKTKELQLVFFNNTNRIKNYCELIKVTFADKLNLIFRIISNPIFPIGTRRREWAKSIYYSVIPKRNSGVANINQGENK